MLRFKGEKVAPGTMALRQCGKKKSYCMELGLTKVIKNDLLYFILWGKMQYN